VKARLALCTGLLAVVACSTIGFAADENIKPAVTATDQWVALVDAGQYGAAWEQASSVFQEKVTKAQWEETMKTVRAPFGKMQSRYLLSAEYKTQLPNVPAGEYVTIQYQSKFAHAPNMIETVTPMLDKDGKWKVSGYFVKAGQ
jgi:hypothetical protein